MNRSATPKSPTSPGAKSLAALSLALPLALATTGCESVSSGVSGFSNFFESSFSSSKKKDSLLQVDDLLERIEQVHVEAETSKESVHTAMTSLRALVAPEFGGNAVQSYAAFTSSITASEKQAEKLRASVVPMEKTAQQVFTNWAKSLESYSNAVMRERSQLRLEDTRNRYEAIISSIEPALWAYDALNRTLRDHALFLSHDFNATSVSELESEVEGLMRHASQLDKRFDSTLKAAKRYVRSAALRGQVEGGEDPVQPPR